MPQEGSSLEGRLKCSPTAIRKVFGEEAARERSLVREERSGKNEKMELRVVRTKRWS